MTSPTPDAGLPPFGTYVESFATPPPQAPEPHPVPALPPLVVLLGDRQVGTATNDGGVLTMTITDPLASAVLRGSVAGLSVAFDLSGGER